MFIHRCAPNGTLFGSPVYYYYTGHKHYGSKVTIQNTNKHLKIVCYVMHTNNDTDGYRNTRNNNRHVGLYSHLEIMNTGIERKAILK